MQVIVQYLGVNMTRTTPPHPQSDVMVERYVETVEKHLRKFAASHQRDWARFLELFAYLYLIKG
jgi:hypothetical protein